MGFLNIVYFVFCIVSAVYEQSIHCQVDKIKMVDAWKFAASDLYL